MHLEEQLQAEFGQQAQHAHIKASSAVSSCTVAYQALGVFDAALGWYHLKTVYLVQTNNFITKYWDAHAFILSSTISNFLYMLTAALGTVAPFIKTSYVIYSYIVMTPSGKEPSFIYFWPEGCNPTIALKRTALKETRSCMQHTGSTYYRTFMLQLRAQHGKALMLQVCQFW